MKNKAIIIAGLMITSCICFVSCNLLQITVPIIENEKEISSAEDEFSDLENSILTAINNMRKEHNLDILVVNEDLNAAAAIRAMEQVERFDHTRPDGTPWWTVSPLCKGECLARGNKNNINKVVKTWQLSPQHNALLLDDRFKNVGIAIYEFNDTYYVALELGTNILYKDK